MNIKISILIASYKRPELLNFGLYSFTRHIFPCDVEFIVVNDGINDETEEICCKFSSKLNIKYIFSGKRNISNNMLWRGPGVAYNIASKESSGSHIVLSCAEMYLLTNAVASIYYQILQTPNCRISTNFNRYDGGKILEHIRQNDGNIIDMDIVNSTDILRTDIPFFMSIPKQAYIDINGYDEDFATGISFDDDDLMFRLDRYGIKPVLVPGTVIHLCHHDKSHADRGYNTEDWEVAYCRNKTMFNERKTWDIVRNKNREWGVNS